MNHDNCNSSNFDENIIKESNNIEENNDSSNKPHNDVLNEIDGKKLTQKTVSGIIWKLAERVGAQIVTMIVSIILARILLPEDYGVVSIVTIVITLLNVFVTYGLGTSLIQKKNSDQLDFSTVFYSSIALSLALYIILFFVARPIAIFYENDQIIWVLRVIGLRLPLAAINSVQQAYVSKKMIFRKFFFATLIGTIISGIVGIVMAYCGYGVWSLVAQYLTNVSIDTIVLFIILKWKPSFAFSFKRLKSLFSYGWKLLLSGLIDTGYNEMRSIVIGKQYSPTDLAFYDKGKQFPSLIAVNVNVSISSVLFAAMSKIQESKDMVKEATRKSVRICSYLIFPCMMGLACIAEPFVKVVLTDKWLEIVPYMQIMCFVYAFWPVHVANLEALKAIGRSDIFLILEIIKKIIGVIVLLSTMWFGVFWIAIGMAITTLTSAVINAFPNRKLLNYSYGEQMIDLLPNLIICIVMGIPVYALNYIDCNIYLLLCIQIFVGIVMYLILSFITKNYSFSYLIKFSKSTFFKKRKYTFDDYINKNKKRLKKSGINIDYLDNYTIYFDNSKKFFIAIFDVNDEMVTLKYIHFDRKFNYVEKIKSVFLEVFNTHEKITRVEIDFSARKKIKKYGYDDIILR